MSLLDVALGATIGYFVGKSAKGRRLQENPARVSHLGQSVFVQGPYTEKGAKRRRSQIARSAEVTSARVVPLAAGGWGVQFTVR
jgi:hypothetical protein